MRKNEKEERKRKKRSEGRKNSINEGVAMFLFCEGKTNAARVRGCRESEDACFHAEDV
jgi:hypothetical protein